MLESSRQAVEILRDPSLFSWHVIPVLAFVIYVYAVEIEKRNLNTVFAGLAFYGVEWFWEILNALVLHFSDYSALWTTTGGTAFQLLVGLTIEISLMFAVAGVIIAKVLPADKKMKILGLPNRWFIVIVFAVFCMFVEVLLSRTPYFVWNYSWWNWPHVWLIFVAYAVGNIVAVYVHDMPELRLKINFTIAVFALDAVLLILFAGILKWI